MPTCYSQHRLFVKNAIFVSFPNLLYSNRILSVYRLGDRSQLKKEPVNATIPTVAEPMRCMSQMFMNDEAVV